MYCGVPNLLVAVTVLACGIPHAAANDVTLPDRLEGHGGPVKSVVLSADGRTALTGSFDYTAIFWRMEEQNGSIVHRLVGHNAAVNDAAFVPNSNLAVSVSDDGAFAVWDLVAGGLKGMVSGGGDKVLDVAVSPDGRHAAAARWDGTARLYDIASAQETGRFEGHRGNVNSVIFSADSQRLFSASYDGEIRVFEIGEAARGTSLYSHGWGINVIDLLPDDQIVFGTLDGIIGVLNPATGESRTLGNFIHPILSVDVSASAGWFAAGGADGHIRVFDLETFELVEDHVDPYGPVWGLSFTPDGKRIYRTGLDDFVSHWQVSPRKPFEASDSVYPRRFQVTEGEDPGEVEFRRKCSICHTLTPDDGNRAGPTLYGLFGRRAGSVEGYQYSDALLGASIIWNEETIGRLFDEGPDVLTPGTKMPIQRLKSIERRDALIAYLRDATDPAKQKERRAGR